MRPIKFKIWYPDSNLMEGPFDIDLLYIPNSVHPKFVTSDRHYYLQYTGLNDKNDKEIYEGDILAATHAPLYNMVVNFEHGSFCAQAPWVEIKSLWGFRFSIHNFEIIGNIYRNPELLRKDK